MLLDLLLDLGMSSQLEHQPCHRVTCRLRKVSNSFENETQAGGVAVRPNSSAFLFPQFSCIMTKRMLACGVVASK